jgi:hypothetical protein
MDASQSVQTRATEAVMATRVRIMVDFHLPLVIFSVFSSHTLPLLVITQRAMVPLDNMPVSLARSDSSPVAAVLATKVCFVV